MSEGFPKAGFAFNVYLEEREDGGAEWKVNWFNKDVPTEIFLMNMKAFINLHEKAYNLNFTNKST